MPHDAIDVEIEPVGGVPDLVQVVVGVEDERRLSVARPRRLSYRVGHARLEGHGVQRGAVQLKGRAFLRRGARDGERADPSNIARAACVPETSRAPQPLDLAGVVGHDR